MNKFFNNLNEFTTELFVIFKEIMEHHSNFLSPNLQKRLKSLMTIVIDLCRILEMMVKHAPEIFVDKEGIQCNRLMSYLMFILNSVFKGQVDVYLQTFSQKLKT